MRIAVVSDIHGNRTAFDAVLADLRETSPDLILHGGDLSDSGSSAAYVIDHIRDLGWPGVYGNTDEMLFDPESLAAFARPLPQLKAMFDVIEEMAAFTREALGEERIAWLRALPPMQVQGSMALVHASPGTAWRAPAPEVSDEELQSTYGALDHAVAVYGHLDRSFVRRLPAMTVANSGSVSLSYDGDPRASYLLLDEGAPVIRRVEYDVVREVEALSASGLPHADWIARILRSAAPQMP
ncbi:MAG TPA: metallophosphoesterase family protein [Bryobacteraceae bacterium]|nr:metallophosphoesterase family protein [Bryobacteraceae bacterium]